MFNFIKFSKGFEEGSKFYNIKELKEDKEFMQHKREFEKNSYVIENCDDEDLPVIEDIEMREFSYEGMYDLMLNITACDNAVDIRLDVDVETGNINYTMTNRVKKYITPEEFFNVNKAIESVYHMIRKFAEYCNEEALKVAEDIVEIIGEDYKCELNGEGTLKVEHNNVIVTIKDFPKNVSEYDLDFNSEIETNKGKKLKPSDLETANNIMRDIKTEIKEVWE